MSPKYKLKYWFEWSADTTLWGENTLAKSVFGYPIDPEQLPLKPETIQRIYDLSRWHDTALNWDYPPDPGPWKQEECDRFNAAAKQLYETIVVELGADFEVVNACVEEKEDPRLGFDH